MLSPGYYKLPARDTLAFFAICIAVYFIKNAVQNSKKPQSTMKVSHTPDGPEYDGYEQHNRKLKNGKTADVHINIQALSGSLNISITRTGTSEEKLFDERKIRSRLCDVPVTTPGTYKIMITANHFRGSYDVKWK